MLTAYRSDFVDGTQGEGVRVEHGYARSGLYRAELTVTDDSRLANAAASDSREVRVNAPPVPELSLRPERPCPGEEVTLSAEASKDPDGTLTAWEWDFGEGSEAQGAAVTHRYDRPGRYSLGLSVTDDSGLSNARASVVQDVAVNQAPIAVIRGPLMGCPGQPIAFDASGSLDADGRITAYGWSFGDGGQAEGVAVTHVYREAGRRPVTLTLTDDSASACALGQAAAEAVVNTAPEARIRASSQIAWFAR